MYVCACVCALVISFVMVVTISPYKDFTHQLKTEDTKILWNISNKGVVFTLMDAYKLAQVWRWCPDS